jgi:hypothetical protein
MSLSHIAHSPRAPQEVPQEFGPPINVSFARGATPWRFCAVFEAATQRYA